MKSFFERHRERGMSAVTLEITDQELHLATDPERFGAEVRYQLAAAVVAKIMEKIGPALEAALTIDEPKEVGEGFRECHFCHNHTQHTLITERPRTYRCGFCKRDWTP